MRPIPLYLLIFTGCRFFFYTRQNYFLNLTCNLFFSAWKSQKIAHFIPTTRHFLVNAEITFCSDFFYIKQIFCIEIQLVAFLFEKKYPEKLLLPSIVLSINNHKISKSQTKFNKNVVLKTAILHAYDNLDYYASCLVYPCWNVNWDICLDSENDEF